MKLLSGLFDLLASKSDADASNLIDGLAKEAKEKLEKRPDGEGTFLAENAQAYGTVSGRPSFTGNGQAYGAKPAGTAGSIIGQTPSGDGGRATNTVAQGYRPLEGGFAAYIGPQEAPFGISWGPKMPKEPNQFNSHKSYDRYFREVFREEFPEYEIIEENGGFSRPARVFTFWKDGKRALVVEVISQSTEARRRRNECRRMGTPYLRYYYDHEGWWNTRQYVIERTRHALSGQGNFT